MGGVCASGTHLARPRRIIDLECLMKNLPDRIIGLRSRSRDVPVLSLHLPVGPGGTVMRASWRQRADALLKDVGDTLGPEDDREAFAHARDAVERALDEEKGAPAPGTWVLFASGQGMLFSELIPTDLPARASFTMGPSVAPLLGLPELEGSAVLVLLDAEKARLFTVKGTAVTEVLDLLAERQLDTATHAGVSKRAATSSGVRGESGKDRAERNWSAESARFAKRVRSAVVDLAKEGEAVLLAGGQRMVQAVAVELTKARTVRVLESLSATSPLHAIEEVVPEALSDLAKAGSAEAMERIEGSAGAARRGCLGWNDTLRALKTASVQTLFLSAGLIRSNPDAADEMVGMSLDQGGTVAQLTGEAGERLEREHEGVAALLRYQVTEPSSAAS